jgi:hypothetical protein
MPPAEFEPAIPASSRPQTHALDRAATGIGIRVTVKQANRAVYCHWAHSILRTAILPNVLDLSEAAAVEWMGGA